jgi:hypothetical protein
MIERLIPEFDVLYEKLPAWCDGPAGSVLRAVRARSSTRASSTCRPRDMGRTVRTPPSLVRTF